ncbi:PfkB family carbohydrate kinase [Azospirillum sp. ST 5-10]|uniref:PfkB family carbohydrate kinase n=1 Tax=unclassified Azospirillum TaxID=2630922 RepID=UPI003F4A0E85
MAAFDVATVGDNCIDRYLPPVGLSTVGGNAVNVAVHLSRLGRRVAYFGAVGDDGDGRRTLDALRANGVDVGHVQVVAGGRTAYSEITVRPGGDRVISFEEFGVCAGYRVPPADLAVLRTLRHVHLGWLDDGGAAKRALLGTGLSLSQDLGVHARAETLDPRGLAVAFASTAADPGAAEARLADLLAGGAGLAVVTMGGLGSMASRGHGIARAGIAPAAVTDTLGAGDTFIAAFLDALLRGCRLEDCLTAARDAAAGTCGHYGGFPQTPLPLAGGPA